MRHDTFIRQKLKEVLGSYANVLKWEFVVEPQGIIEVKLAHVFETSDWKEITETIEAMGGCWEPDDKAWKIPYFLSTMNLPSCDEKFNPHRLHIRSLNLRNLVFLYDTFKGKLPKSWREIQSALFYFALNSGTRRTKYSKAACRDYLGALLALETR